MDVAGRGNMGNSATYLYINERLVKLAKVAVIARRQITWFSWCGVCFGFSVSMTLSDICRCFV